jgi:hypothetical protein
VTPSTRYLLYAEDGATLIYAGPDAAEYERRCRQLAVEYAGSLKGTRSAGRHQQWEVRAYFRARPPRDFVERRRQLFRFRLDWEPTTPATIPDAAGGS